MSDKTETTLRDGTLVRHRSNGYQGKIEGTTSIRACFTRGGTSVQAATSKEVLEAAAEITCVACHKQFQTKPGLAGKACGRCACGNWICPVCMACQTEEAAKNKATACLHQRKRFSKKVLKKPRA